MAESNVYAVKHTTPDGRTFLTWHAKPRKTKDVLVTVQNGVKVTVDISGLSAVADALDGVAHASVKAVRSAASAAATVEKQIIKSNMPKASGTMRKAVSKRAKPERSKTRGKKMYDIWWNPAYNDVLQKPIKNAGSRGGHSPKYAYYPASQEYGFMTSDGNGGYKYIPGSYYMRDAAHASESEVARVFVEKLNSNMKKELKAK